MACAAAASVLAAGACGSQTGAPGRATGAHPSGATTVSATVAGATTQTGSGGRARAGASVPPRPRPFELRVQAPSHLGTSWEAVARVGEQPVAWVANRSGVTLLRFDQAHARLDLHAGTAEPEGGGWPYGGDIGAREIHRVVAAFNGGFKLSYGSVGFVAGRHVAVPLSEGLGSIVTYADGSTQIGSWLHGVPARSRPITSVLQNLSLMIDHGAPAASVEACTTCWGATLGGGDAVARSALGITAGGQLVWAGGESLTPTAIAAAMVSAGVQRAVELDINPEWVAGYLYVHRAAGPVAVPAVPGQSGIPGQLLAPYSRDFFTIVAR
jgi:hypothetical protein